ncbi:hypothetical protein [Paenibacillus aestuarii]|uniref:Uncharacterized protein n=1 Tax=Paenibacillus aestuarii TaxID=516965 RepID=A0ABW0K231_9BACL|nr:hypothetical protein [Paenibacillus aestuarii]
MTAYETARHKEFIDSAIVRHEAAEHLFTVNQLITKVKQMLNYTKSSDVVLELQRITSDISGLIERLEETGLNGVIESDT